MLGDRDLVAFAATTDGDRARAFYEGALGLRLVEDSPYALVFDADGTPLRITRVQSFRPQPFTVLGWSVPDIEATVDGLAGRGVVFQRFDGMDQDARGIWTAHGGVRIAWFLDPDGNVLSLQGT